MEGLLQLREMAEAIRVSRSDLSCALGGASHRGRNARARDRPKQQRFGNKLPVLCLAGFTRGGRDDVLVMCEAYDILHQERAEDATHVVLPFTREDMSLLRPSVVERWLPADARGAGTPVVTIEFLFDLIAAIKTFDAVLGRQGMAYAVGGLGGVGEEGEIGVTDMTDMTGRCRVGSLKVFGNEMYGASSLPNADSSLTRVEACDESEEQLQSVPDDSEYGGNENLDLNVHTPGTTPGTTPGDDTG